MANILLRCSDERLNDIACQVFNDRLTLARLGGIKWYLSKNILTELYNEIQFAIEHKHAQTIDIMSHTDCGLYKQLRAVRQGVYEYDLQSAKDAIAKRFPSIMIRIHIFDVSTKTLQDVT